MSVRQPISAAASTRLLLVGNDQDDHYLLCDLLDAVREVRFAIDRAACQKTALEQLEHQDFDACLVDGDLPDNGALTFLKNVRAQNQAMPVLLLNARRSRPLDLDAMALGASGCLEKDRLDPTLLERSIRYAINQSDVIEKLGLNALQDEATGLATPSLFRHRLGHAMALAKRVQTLTAMVMIDCAGTLDEIELPERLNRLAAMLQRNLEATETATILYDHDLALILEGERSAETIVFRTQKILRLIKTTLRKGDSSSAALPKAGIAICPHDGHDSVEIIQLARNALHRAKAAEDASYCLANDQLDKATRGLIIPDQDLKEDLQQGRLALRYRPVVHLTSSQSDLSGDVHLTGTGTPSLSTSRWAPLAEEPSLIAALTDWTMGQLAEQIRTWQRQGWSNSELSIPFLSSRASQLPLLESAVQQHLSPSVIDPHRLEIDLSQNLVFEDMKEGGSGLKRLKEQGFRLAINGFNPKEASIQLLATSFFDSLKLSSHLYQGLPGDKRRETQLKAIIGFGRNLGLRVVADGVSDERQLIFLKDIGFDAIRLTLSRTSLSADKFMNRLHQNISTKMLSPRDSATETSLKAEKKERFPRTVQSSLSSFETH